MAGGYMGRVLWVDLSSGKISEETPDEKFNRAFVGGYGWGSKTIFDRQKPHVDPLGPDNILGILSGPLTGTPAIIGSRYVVVGKSPLTGTWGDANSGGYFGPHMKFAGVDGVYFTGKADKPVYLLIDDGKAELRDASHLWGKTTIETRDWAKAEFGPKAEEACIGPAGERKSLIACVINDYGRAAGRSGLGAVMGAKRVKAVIVRGDQKPPVANPDLARELRRKYAAVKGMGAYDVFTKYGTPGVMDGNVVCGDAGIKNWKGVGPVDFPTYQKIGMEAVIAEQAKKYFCWQCTLGCGGEMKPKEGRAKFSHKPEYETLASAGSMCLVDDLEAIIRINDIVNAYGLDSISAPVTIAFAMECYEKGLITIADTDGLDLRWGNAEAAVELCRKIAVREGFGDVLADGVRMAAQRIGGGAEIYAMHVQGQEIPMHDPRFLPGLQVTYQLDATPARHTQGSELIAAPDMNVAPYDKYAYGTAGKQHYQFSNTMHFVNAAGLCMFGYISYPIQSLVDFTNAICGWDVTREEIEVTGERIANVRHAFNLREGLNPLNFVVPPRLLGNPPLQKGNTRGVTVDAAKNNASYLEVMQWDPETAMPSPARLEELGLSDVAKALGY